MNKKTEIIELWRLCFDDTDEFIHRFFREIYTDSNTLIIEREGKVVSALQILPYTFNYYGTEFQASYIYGVCTHPNYRKQGLMYQLLKQAFAKQRERGAVITFLIPAETGLFDIYRRSGFTEVFDIQDEQLTIRPIPSPNVTSIESVSAYTTAEIQQYINKKLKQYPISVLHSERDVQFLLHDIICTGGDCYIYHKDHEIAGLAMAVPTTQSIYLSELLSDMPNIERELLNFIADHYQCSTIRYRTLPDKGEGRAYGMARVLQPELLFPIWKELFSTQDLTFAAFSQQTIQQQTAQLMSYSQRKNYMSLMMD